MRFYPIDNDVKMGVGNDWRVFQSENFDLDFTYDNTDTLENEIAEIYSYTEGGEFNLNLKVSRNYK